MSALATKHNAINLSQGFPSFDCPKYLAHQAQSYIAEGMNQYCPMTGVPKLQHEIAALTKRMYARDVDSDEITITSGATEALFVAIQAIVHPGDEVIVFDPAYDSYAPAIELAGGKSVHISLEAPEYAIDWHKVISCITDNTKAIIINTPHNPTGAILTAADIAELNKIVTQHDLYLISDEVYEYIIFDGEQHQSVLRYDDLYQRTFVISSFGKTFHVTGWKVGYCVAPPALTAEFRKVHQYVTFCTSTPMQHAIADMLATDPQHVDELSDFYQQKRDAFVNLMQESRFKLLPCKGTYFQLLDYSAISDLDDMAFATWLTEEKGIATVPLSPFYAGGSDAKVVRVCFAKDQQTLEQAAEILCQL